MKPRLKLQNLSFSYESNREVLSGISFSVSEGESVALIGTNGAGKSTLLLHTNGTLFSQRGNVSVSGIEVTPKNVAHARQQIGLVFQDPDDQLFMPTVEQDVAFGPKNMGCSADEIERRVENALAMVGATELRKRFSHKLSGGEKRRVTIATVLAMEPSLLVLDEPSSHLDPRARSSLIRLLQGLPHAKIIATHDLDMVWDLCSRTLVLHEGRLVYDGPTRDILSDEKSLATWGLEKPLRLHACPVCNAHK